MREFPQVPEEVLVVGWRPGNGRDEGNDGGTVARPDPPHVQIREMSSRIGFEAPADLLGERSVVVHVEKDAPRVPQKTEGPAGDDHGANDPHERVHPQPTQEAAGGEGNNGEEGGKGISDHMQVGASQVVIPVVVAATVFRDWIAENKRRCEVYRQTEDGDGNRLIKRDCHRPKQAAQRLVSHERGYEAENKGARVAGELPNLSGAEGEPRVRGAAASEEIAEGREPQGRRMTRHMPAIGKKRHRPKEISRDDFHDHHRRGEPDYDARVSLVGVLGGAEKHMLMGARREMIAGHQSPPTKTST